MTKKRRRHETGVETTGHDWDGIKELNNPLPRWWLWTLLPHHRWGLWYVIAYPAWPLINGATAGYLGFSTRANVAADIAAFDEKNADLRAALTEVDLTKLEENEELSRFAVAGGGLCFRPAVRNATALVRRAQRAIQTCWTTTGSGAARSKISPIRSTTASATRSTPMRAGPKCPPLARSLKKDKSIRLCNMSPRCHRPTTTRTGRIGRDSLWRELQCLSRR